MNEQNSFCWHNAVMKLFIIIFMSVISGCSEAAEEKIVNVGSEVCDIFFKMTDPCVYKNIVALIGVKQIASDEKILKRLDVINKGVKYSLTIVQDTSMLEGDRGYISFSDINFDGIPDIAITTSFGLANLYVDYWVFNSLENSYIYIGNFTELKVDINYKTLSNTVKLNAAKYVENTYSWESFKLIKKN